MTPAPDLARLRELLEKATPALRHDASARRLAEILKAGVEATPPLSTHIVNYVSDADLIVALVNAAPALLAAAEREGRMREALTPSVETKAAYIGEFSIPFPDVGEDGEEYMRSINVPWDTIKEIMAAIRARAFVEKHGRKG